MNLPIWWNTMLKSKGLAFTDVEILKIGQRTLGRWHPPTLLFDNCWLTKLPSCTKTSEHRGLFSHPKEVANGKFAPDISQHQKCCTCFARQKYTTKFNCKVYLGPNWISLIHLHKSVQWDCTTVLDYTIVPRLYNKIAPSWRHMHVIVQCSYMLNNKIINAV